MPIDRTAFNALVDNVTVWNKTQIKDVILDPVDNAFAAIPPIPSGLPAIPITQTISLTGNQNNIVLVAGCTLLKCNNASLLTITGLSAGIDGQQLDIVSIGVGQIDIADQSGSSIAANRIKNGVVGLRSLVGGLGKISLIYDTTQALWIVLHHEQGSWISPAYSSGNFVTFGGMAWTVSAANVIECIYYLRGRQLHVDIFIDNTIVNVTGGVSPSLKINSPAFGGYTLISNPNHFYPLLVKNNGTWMQGYMNHDTSGLYFQNSMSTTNWPSSGGSTGVQFSGIVNVS